MEEIKAHVFEILYFRLYVHYVICWCHLNRSQDGAILVPPQRLGKKYIN